jgi:hypothetical protein
MFAKSIIDSDSFLDMPLSTQALYFHLAMRADDDGFVNNPKRIQRMIGSSDDELKVLIAKQYILPFESGVVVIKHWRIHNYIQKDRYHPSECPEKSLVKAEKGKPYELLDTECIQTCIQDGNIGKVSIGKDSIGEIEGVSDDTPPTQSKKNKVQYAEAVKMTEAEYVKLVEQIGEEGTKWCIDKLNNYKLSKGKKYKNDYRAIVNWTIGEYEKQNGKTKAIVGLPSNDDGFYME